MSTLKITNLHASVDGKESKKISLKEELNAND